MISKFKHRPIDLASIYIAINHWLPEVIRAGHESSYLPLEHSCRQNPSISTVIKNFSSTESSMREDMEGKHSTGYAGKEKALRAIYG